MRREFHGAFCVFGFTYQRANSCCAPKFLLMGDKHRIHPSRFFVKAPVKPPFGGFLNTGYPQQKICNTLTRGVKYKYNTYVGKETKMVIRKITHYGTAVCVTLPPAFCREAKLTRGDIVSVELGREDEIIIKRVDLKALAQMRKENAKNRK